MVYTEHMNAAAVSYEEVEDVSLQMARADRSRLASKLLESLDYEDGLSPEWLAEVKRRIAAIDAGTATLVPREEAMKRITDHLASLRS